MAAVITLGCLGLIGLLIVESVLRGWVLTYLWGWFLVPLGLPPIGIAHAIGVALLVGMITHQSQPDCESPSREVSEHIGRVVGHLIGPFVALLVGYIAQSFM